MSTGIITLPQSNKILYTFLRLFYVENMNDLYITTIIDICKDYPINEQTNWINALIVEIQLLPILGPLQASKTNYVVSTLQNYLTNLSTKLAIGLPGI